MKFLTVFVGLFAVAFGYQATWTINSLSEAIQNPSTSPEMLPYLNQALDELMHDLVLGSAGYSETTISTGAMDLTMWSIHDLSEAIQDPSLDPVLRPFLEHALDILMENIYSGNIQTTIVVATPAGLLDIDTIKPVVTPGAVSETIAPVAASGPLVQIIVKVNGQDIPVQPEVIVPQPVVLPAPAQPEVIVPQPVVLPAPAQPEVVIVPQPVVMPAPAEPEVVIVPQPVVLPAPVAPEVHPEAAINPVDVIAINPVSGTNPVDVIAVTPVEVNPVDLISPIPVAATGAVGPIV